MQNFKKNFVSPCHLVKVVVEDTRINKKVVWEQSYHQTQEENMKENFFYCYEHINNNIKMRVCQLQNMVIHQEQVDNSKRLADLANFRKATKWQQGIETWYVIESEHYTTITRGVQKQHMYLQQWQFNLDGIPVTYRRWKEE